MLNRVSGKAAIAEAVEVFFDRSKLTLPLFVPRMESFLISIACTFCLFVIGLRSILEDRSTYRDSPNAVKQFRWVVMLGILFAVCSSIHNGLSDTLYMFKQYSVNSQHFANVYWFGKYCEAARLGS